MDLTRQVEVIRDRDAWLERRKGFLGASEIAAVFHAHPHVTCLELWAQKSGRIEREEGDNQSARRGRLFESAVAAALREENPSWIIHAQRTYHTLPDQRIAATPDFLATDGQKHMLIQAKVVTPDKFEEEWKDAPPVHYLMQLQTELLCTGMEHGVLAPLIFDNWKFPVHAYHFKADPAFQASLLQGAAQFWAAVHKGREPRLKLPQDRDTLGRMFPDGAEPPMIMAGRDDLADLCTEKLLLGQRIKVMEERKDTIDGVLMNEMRNHSKAEIPGRFKLSWSTVAASTISYERKAYRRFSISAVKPKKTAE